MQKLCIFTEKEHKHNLTTMKYSEAFVKLVESGKFNYIGHGNPNAKILIVSKEPAANKDSDLYKRDIEDNCRQWKDNIANCDKISYDTLKDSIVPFQENYNPLYPHKGQKCTVRTKTNKLDENKQPIFKGANGTARTWVAYQKLYDRIAGKPDKRKEEDIDFHKYVFSTDFSNEAAPMSNLTNTEETGKSIVNRNEMFKDKFFQNFPIVIIAAGHYPRYYKINLEEIFQVNWVSPTDDSCGKGKFIKLHYNITRTKLLIQTNQMSGFSYKLLNDIAEAIRDFISNDLKQDITEFLEK